MLKIETNKYFICNINDNVKILKRIPDGITKKNQNEMNYKNKKKSKLIQNE